MMTKKKDIVKLNKLHLIKRRRMQKFHARKDYARTMVVIQNHYGISECLCQLNI